MYALLRSSRLPQALFFMAKMAFLRFCVYEFKRLIWSERSYLSLYICVHICVYIYMCVCIYTYIDIHIYVYVYIYMYIIYSKNIYIATSAQGHRPQATPAQWRLGPRTLRPRLLRRKTASAQGRFVSQGSRAQPRVLGPA